MNEKDIVQHMITFVEDKERQVVSNKLVVAVQNRGDTVNAILNELEKVTKDENK